jgi:broad specificity phosphatase PhoE
MSIQWTGRPRRIIVMRHFQATSNAEARKAFESQTYVQDSAAFSAEAPLTDFGIQHGSVRAHELVSDVGTCPRIYTSPTVRALQSAHILNGVFLNSVVVPDDRLVEMNKGAAFRMSLRDRDNDFPLVRKHLGKYGPYLTQLPEGESLKQVAHGRVTSFLESLPHCDTVVLVTHSGTMLGIQAVIEGWGDAQATRALQSGGMFGNGGFVMYEDRAGLYIRIKTLGSVMGPRAVPYPLRS